MESEHYAAIQTLAKCSFYPGSFEKRFVRSLAEKSMDDALSEKQIAALKKIARKYRKQIGRVDPDFDLTFAMDHPYVMEAMKKQKVSRSVVAPGQLKLFE